MIDLVLMAVFFMIGGGLVLAGFLIWTFRDVIGYAFEVLGYTLQSLIKVIIGGAAAFIEWADEQLYDFDLADDPLWRALIIGGIGFFLGVGMLILLSMILGQPWVIITLMVAVALGVIVGLIADPDKDWSLGAFPVFPRGGRGDGPKLPLNL